MRRSWLLALTWLCFPAPLFAQRPRITFRGQSPGSPPSALSDSASCTPGLFDGERRCEIYVDIGSQGVPVTYAYLNGRLYHVLFTFSPSAFPEMRDIFRAKYGAPNASRTEPYGTRGGTRTRNAIVTWRFPDGELVMREYGSNISEGKDRLSRMLACAPSRWAGSAPPVLQRAATWMHPRARNSR
jgi:hypothetical protein